MSRREMVSHPHSEVARLARAAVALAVSYYLGARIGMMLTPESQPISALWPPNAILMGGLLLAPTRWWPVLLGTVLPIQLGVQLPGGVPLSMTLSWFVSNSVEATLGAAFVRTLIDGPVKLDRVSSIMIFVVGCVIVAPLASSFVDAAFVVLNGWGDLSYWQIWRYRSLSNAVANLTIVPLILNWSGRSIRELRASPQPRALEAIAIGLCLALVCIAIFANTAGRASSIPAVLYLLLPVILWTVVRFGPGGTSLAFLCLAGVATWGAVHGRGPFVDQSYAQNVVALQLFIIATYLPILALTGVIRERARAEEGAKLSAQQLQIALASARMGAWELNLRSGEVVLSAESRAILGLPADVTAIGYRRFLSMVDLSDRKTLKSAIVRSFDEDTLSNAEFRMVGMDGETRWLQVRGTVLRDGPEAEGRLVGVVTDVTSRRRVDHELVEQRRELAHLGRVATLGEMSGALAHELSQPLAAILANARAGQRMISRGNVDTEDLNAVLTDIAVDDLRAAAVVQRVRRLIRKGPSDPQPVVMNEVVTEVLDITRNDLTQRAVTVTTRLTPTITPIVADRIQMQQVLLNLIVNACDAMADVPPRERRLAIQTAEEPDGIHLSVSDRGPGIAGDSLETVFEPFVSSKEHGLGLGLAICRSIVKSHGGGISARNNPDRGATLTVVLPVDTRGEHPAFAG